MPKKVSKQKTPKSTAIDRKHWKMWILIFRFVHRFNYDQIACDEWITCDPYARLSTQKQQKSLFFPGFQMNRESLMFVGFFPAKRGNSKISSIKNTHTHRFPFTWPTQYDEPIDKNCSHSIADTKPKDGTHTHEQKSVKSFVIVRMRSLTQSGTNQIKSSKLENLHRFFSVRGFIGLVFLNIITAPIVKM